LVVGVAGGAWYRRLRRRISRKTAKATMRNSITVLRNSP
jgi:hypothetical protein